MEGRGWMRKICRTAWWWRRACFVCNSCFKVLSAKKKLNNHIAELQKDSTSLPTRCLLRHQIICHLPLCRISRICLNTCWWSIALCERPFKKWHLEFASPLGDYLTFLCLLLSFLIVIPLIYHNTFWSFKILVSFSTFFWNWDCLPRKCLLSSPEEIYQSLTSHKWSFLLLNAVMSSLFFVSCWRKRSSAPR